MSDQALFEAAKAVMARAHAPYSDFPVGAALMTPDGRIFSGANVENASYPEGWCAETSAIAQMVSAGGSEISAIAVIAEKLPLVTPCGGCRQRIREFATPETRVILCNPSGPAEVVSMADLLPRAFDAEALE